MILTTSFIGQLLQGEGGSGAKRAEVGGVGSGEKKGNEGERKFRENRRDSVWRAGVSSSGDFSQEKNKEQVDGRDAKRNKQNKSMREA